MPVVVMRQRTHDRQLVGLPSETRHVLAEENARHVGGDRIERPANFGRSVGLGIERVEVRRSALEPDEYTRAGAAKARARAAWRLAA